MEREKKVSSLVDTSYRYYDKYQLRGWHAISVFPAAAPYREMHACSCFTLNFFFKWRAHVERSLLRRQLH